MIIITTYHINIYSPDSEIRKKYLSETIRSIDNQRIKDLIHIIIDDGSNDDTFKELKRKYANSINRYVFKREKHPAEILTSTNARNFALDLCLESTSTKNINLLNQKYITFIDSDDVVINLNKRLNFLENNNVDFLFTDALIFFDNIDKSFVWSGINNNISRVYNTFWVKGKMPYPTMTWSINFLRELKTFNNKKYNKGIFDSKIGCGEDVDVALSSLECARELNYKIGYLPEITAGYRIHNLSLTCIRNQKDRKREENAVLIRHFGKYHTAILHIKRFLIRPECYIEFFIKIKNAFKKKLSKTDFIKS